MMNEFIQRYLTVLNQERDWSWTLIGIVYLIGGLTIRGWFMNPLNQRLKAIDKKYAHQLKGEYLKRSLWGWLLFFASLAVLILAWYRPSYLPAVLSNKILLLVASGFFGLSILFHLHCFAAAALIILEKAKGNSS